MIYHVAFCILPTGPRARVLAFVSHARQRWRTISIYNAFRATSFVRIPYIFCKATTRASPILFTTNCIRSTRWGVAGVWRFRWDGVRWKVWKRIIQSVKITLQVSRFLSINYNNHRYRLISTRILILSTWGNKFLSTKILIVSYYNFSIFLLAWKSEGMWDRALTQRGNERRGKRRKNESTWKYYHEMRTIQHGRWTTRKLKESHCIVGKHESVL